VVMLQSEPFCYDALDRYLETLTLIQQKTNPGITLAGILTSLMDSRTTIDSAILEKARNDYEDVVFNTVIRRRSRIKEFTIAGIQDQTKADREALETYMQFVEELKQRVQEESHSRPS
jgi:chromosome partitioning protein